MAARRTMMLSSARIRSICSGVRDTAHRSATTGIRRCRAAGSGRTLRRLRNVRSRNDRAGTMRPDRPRRTEQAELDIAWARGSLGRTRLGRADDGRDRKHDRARKPDRPAERFADRKAMKPDVARRSDNHSAGCNWEMAGMRADAERDEQREGQANGEACPFEQDRQCNNSRDRDPCDMSGTTDAAYQDADVSRATPAPVAMRDRRPFRGAISRMNSVTISATEAACATASATRLIPDAERNRYVATL